MTQPILKLLRMTPLGQTKDPPSATSPLPSGPKQMLWAQSEEEVSKPRVLAQPLAIIRWDAPHGRWRFHVRSKPQTLSRGLPPLLSYLTCYQSQQALTRSSLVTVLRITFLLWTVTPAGFTQQSPVRVLDEAAVSPCRSPPHRRGFHSHVLRSPTFSLPERGVLAYTASCSAAVKFTTTFSIQFLIFNTCFTFDWYPVLSWYFHGVFYWEAKISLLAGSHQ